MNVLLSHNWHMSKYVLCVNNILPDFMKIEIMRHHTLLIEIILYCTKPPNSSPFCSHRPEHCSLIGQLNGKYAKNLMLQNIMQKLVTSQQQSSIQLFYKFC